MTPNNTPTSHPDRRPNRPVMERVKTFRAAWELLAHEAKFSCLGLPDFERATAECYATRSRLATLQLERRAAVSDRTHADAVTRLLIKRVVAAVQADPSHGPDSPLYRAMGYCPESERKSSQAAQAGAASKPFVSTMQRLALVKAGWREVAPEARFGGLALGEFERATQSSLAARAQVLELTAALRGRIGDRNAADEAAKKLVKRIVAGVKADPDFGADSPLYRAMGYVPDSERKPRSRDASTTPAADPASQASNDATRPLSAYRWEASAEASRPKLRSQGAAAEQLSFPAPAQAGSEHSPRTPKRVPS